MVTLIFASFRVFFGDGENVENFPFYIFWTITQEPQDILKL